MSSVEQKLDLASRSTEKPAGQSLYLWFSSFKPSTKRWFLYAAILGFCLYRMIGFKPQQLDSPGTLRPILFSWFTWFVGRYEDPEAAFASLSQWCFFLLLIPSILAVLNYAWQRDFIKLPEWAIKIFCSRWLLFASMAVSLIACRFPTLLQDELNPDEGQFLASAHKLFYDPNFFRSVDCGTSGPINVYPLMLPAIFGLTPDFASSRILVLTIILLCTYLLYRSISLFITEDLARFAILLFWGAFAVFKNPELTHYSSEHVPLLLICVALFCSTRLLRSPRPYSLSVFSLGFLTCAAFFTKMQSLPIIVALAGVAVAYVYVAGSVDKIWRPAALFLAGTAPLFVLNAMMCLSGGVWKDFRRTYINANLNYASVEVPFANALSGLVSYVFGTDEVRYFLLTFVIMLVAYQLQKVGNKERTEQGAFLQMLVIGLTIAVAVLPPVFGFSAIHPYFLFLGLATIPMFLLLLNMKREPNRNLEWWFGTLVLAFTGAAVFAIYKAHRPFIHYLLFLYVPLCTAMAWMLMKTYDASQALARGDSNAHNPSRYAPPQLGFIALFVTLTITYQSYCWSLQSGQVFHRVPTTVRPPESDFIRSLTREGERILIWGWNVRPYLGSGRTMATRDSNVASSFRGINMFASPPFDTAGPPEKKVRNYYNERLLRDLRHRPAELIIDAVGPTSWFTNDPKFFGFEQFPAINDFIQAHYVHLVDLYGQRYFIRRDLALSRQSIVDHALLLMKRCQSEALSCMDTTVTWPITLPAVQIPHHALLQVKFVPTAYESEYATVFSNEVQPGSFQGFQLQHVSNNRYKLALGLGDRWAYSEEMLLTPGKPASLAIEYENNSAAIKLNDKSFSSVRLEHSIVNSPGSITLNSWINRDRVFSGEMQFFQIVDLERSH